MPKDAFPIKKTVYISTRNYDIFISKALKSECFRKLESVNFDGKKFEMNFSKEYDYKPKKQFIQFSKKNHSLLTKKDVCMFLEKYDYTKTWTVLEVFEFPNNWLVFLTK